MFITVFTTALNLTLSSARWLLSTISYATIYNMHFNIMWAGYISHYSVWVWAARPGDRSSIPGRGERIFPLASVCRPALGSTQSPVQWVPGVLTPRLKRDRVVTLTTRPHLVPSSRMSRGYTSSSPSAFMACSGTALPFYFNIILPYASTSPKQTLCFRYMDQNIQYISHVSPAYYTLSVLSRLIWSS
jgi:hypothetical protein